MILHCRYTVMRIKVKTQEIAIFFLFKWNLGQSYINDCWQTPFPGTTIWNFLNLEQATTWIFLVYRIGWNPFYLIGFISRMCTNTCSLGSTGNFLKRCKMTWGETVLAVIVHRENALCQDGLTLFHPPLPLHEKMSIKCNRWVKAFRRKAVPVYWSQALRCICGVCSRLCKALSKGYRELGASCESSCYNSAFLIVLRQRNSLKLAPGLAMPQLLRQRPVCTLTRAFPTEFHGQLISLKPLCWHSFSSREPHL